MKKILLFLATVALTATAQDVTVVGTSRLLSDLGAPAYRPILSPDGSRMVFASGETDGLRMYDFTTGALTTVSDLPSAGTDAFWGGDGKVYYITQERRSNKLVYRTGHVYDLASAASEEILEAQHGAVLPVKAARGGGLKGVRSNVDGVKRGTAVYTEGSQLIILKNGVPHTYSPLPSFAGYLWASLSPDGTRVAFFAAGRGIGITDLDGNLLAELGNYEMPCWFDNNYLVAQHATDDGHQFTSSQIMLLKADGSYSHALTEPETMTMQPSAAAGRIVYTTVDGKLYQMNITINP